MRLCLFEPDIPQNCGALLRLAACLGVSVDIIEPCGFLLDDRRLRRAGMDYLSQAAVTRHSSWNAYQEVPRARLVLLTTKATVPYCDFAFRADDTLMLGRESAGVPDAVHQAADHRLLIPMEAGMRSINVAMDRCHGIRRGPAPDRKLPNQRNTMTASLDGPQKRRPDLVRRPARSNLRGLRDPRGSTERRQRRTLCRDTCGPFRAQGLAARGGRRRRDGPDARAGVRKGGGQRLPPCMAAFSPSSQKRFPAPEEDPRFWASGVSLVAHMQSPLVPAVHMNTRHIVTSKSWFGGGSDLNPMYPDDQDTADFHAAFKQACDCARPGLLRKVQKVVRRVFLHSPPRRGPGGRRHFL